MGDGLDGDIHRVEVRSQRGADDETSVLPLFLVDYAAALDLLNTATGGSSRPVDLQIRHQPGGEGGRIDTARALVSHDDGMAWTQWPSVPLGSGRFKVPCRRSGRADFVSLRVEGPGHGVADACSACCERA